VLCFFQSGWRYVISIHRFRKIDCDINILTHRSDLFFNIPKRWPKQRDNKQREIGAPENEFDKYPADSRFHSPGDKRHPDNIEKVKQGEAVYKQQLKISD
jgi:hypothetical protein